MHHIVQNVAKTLSLLIIFVFGVIWLAQPIPGIASTQALPRTYGLTMTAYQRSTATPTPFSTQPVFPTDPPFPTESVFPTAEPYPPRPTWEPYPFPTDDPYPPYPFPTDDPYFPTEEPYPFPTGDPYPYPFPSPSVTATPIGTTIPPTATQQPSAVPSATPTGTTRARDDVATALIAVALRPNPNTVASRSSVDYGLSADAPPSLANDGIVDYTLVVTNRGAGTAKDTIVLLPYASDTQRVLDATFSDDGAYVSRLISDTLTAVEFHTGPLGPSETLTATLRLLVRPDASDGASLSQRATFTWTDDRSGGTGSSNLPLLVVGDVDRDEAFYPLTVSPASASASVQRTISTNVFVPYEHVAMWYTTPVGSAVTISTVQADVNGSVVAVFDSSTLTNGNYILVAKGIWSNITSVAPLTIVP
jgi:hypothetical protein